MKKLIAALLLTTTPAFALDLGAMTDAEKDQFGTAVRAYLMENPQVLIEAMTELEQRRLADEAKNDTAMLSQLSDQIYNDGHSWVGGNPDGDVTVVEFIDYRCGVCRQVFPHVEETVANDGNIKVIFKDLPILGQESDLAARFAVAVQQEAGPEAYKQAHDRLMETRGPVNLESLSQLAGELDVDGKAVLNRMNTEEVSAVIRKNRQLAEQMSVMGTPTFIIGGEMLRGVPASGLEDVIARARAEKG